MSASHEVNDKYPASICTELTIQNEIHGQKDPDQQHAHAFLEQHGHELHPALDPGASTQQDDLEAKDESRHYIFKTALNAHAKDFIEAVEAYKDGWQDPRIRALSLRGKTSWEQVMQEVRQAEERYNLAGESGLRKFARRATDKSAAVVPYLRMLPNDTLWLPAVAGGLRLVFEAFGKISEKREVILKALVRIPDIITQTEDTCENFGPDPALYAKAEKVYIAALAAIEGTIKWLNKKVTGKPISAIKLGPLYDKSFREKLNDIDNSWKALETHIAPVRDSYAATTKRSVQHLEEQMENLEQLQQASKTAIEKMMEVLADTNRTAKWMTAKDVQIRKLKRRVEQFEQAASALSASDLCDILAVPNTHPDIDLQHTFSRIDGNSEEFELACKVNTGEDFKQWQGDDESPPLFIEGGLPLSSRRSTALSIVSSSLIKTLHDSPRATAIYFFCGMHDDTNDSVCGPQGVIRSLISQILRQFDVNLDFISMLSRPLIEKLNIRALCDCFGKLIKQLPAWAVLFCIIDGISFFEKTLWADDTAKVIGDLRGLAYDTDVGATFKLLVTSPRRSTFVASIFEPESRMNVSPSDTRRHASEREVMMANRRIPLSQMQSRPPFRRTLRTQSTLSAADTIRPGGDMSYDSLSDSELLDIE